MSSSSGASAPLPAVSSAADAEATRAQLDAITAEVAEAQPLLSEEEPPSVLLPSYADNPSFLPKLHDLCARYRAIRRTRGDGACFYRALLVSLGEHLVDARVVAPGAAAATAGAVSPLQAKYEQLLSLTVRAEARLVREQGYPASTVPDFREAMTAYLEGLGAPGASKESAVYAPFRDEMSGFYIITFLRLLCSLELLSHADDYLPFIMGVSDCASVKMFCDAEVEPPKRDADQVQIIALAKALDARIAIAYLDAAPGRTLTELVFPQDEAAAAAAGEPLATLLYRPGHFDILYK